MSAFARPTARIGAFCTKHNVRFELKNAIDSVVSCVAETHELGVYPRSERPWEFCPKCLTVWPFVGRTGATRCFSCEVDAGERRLCSRCSVISFSGKDGQLPIICPGCFAEDGQAREHICVEAGRFLTSRSECPFCQKAILAPTAELSVPAFTEPVNSNPAVTAVSPPTRSGARTLIVKEARSDEPRPAPSAVGPPTLAMVPSTPALPTVGVQTTGTPNSGLRVKVIIALTAAILAVLLYLVIGPKTFPAKIDHTLAKRQYFAPPGESAYDIYTDEARKHPNSEDVRAAAVKIRAALEPAATDDLDRFYRDSATQLGWDELERYFAFLHLIAPDDKAFQVRQAYAEGQRKLNKDRDHRGALDAYSRALSLDDSFVLALNGLAKVYVQESSPIRDEQLALSYYQRAAEKDPNFIWPLKNLGEYHMRRGEWTEAENYMTRALRASPERSSILMSMGRIKYNQGRYTDALNYYEHARARASDADDLRRINSSLEQIRQKLNG